MKTEEDEAFDELAKRQGDWGGGYQAKRRMAADKLKVEEDDDIQDYKRPWVWLSDADIRETIDSICQYTGDYEEFLCKKIERKIRSINNG